MCRKDEVKMASKDWKLPDAQHKITEEKGLDIENESIQRQWEKTIVSFIRLEDAFSDIDVYDDTEEGEIPYRQYLMRRWLFIHQDKYKNETLKDEDKKKVNELLKTKHIKEDKFMDVIGGYVEENFAYLLAPDCSYADLEELSNLANEAIGAQMKYPNDVNNMYRNTYNAYPLSKVWNFYTRSWS